MSNKTIVASSDDEGFGHVHPSILQRLPAPVTIPGPLETTSALLQRHRNRTCVRDAPSYVAIRRHLLKFVHPDVKPKAAAWRKSLAMLDGISPA